MNPFKIIKIIIRSRREQKEHPCPNFSGVVLPILNNKYEIWFYRTRKDIFGSKQVFWILYKVIDENKYGNVMSTQEEIPYTKEEVEAMVKTIAQLRKEKQELIYRVRECLYSAKPPIQTMRALRKIVEDFA